MQTFFTTKSIILFISIILLALLAVQASTLFWRNVDSETSYQAMPLVMDQESQKSGLITKSQMVSVIIKQQPFGAVPVISTKQKITPTAIKAPETKLNYKLRGIYYSEDDASSSAIIEIGGRITESYQIHDEVEKGISIHGIELKHIVLNRYGKFEILSLEEYKFIKNNKPIGVQKSVISNAANNRLLQGYKKRFLNNPMALARKFQAIPVTKNGKNIGFRLKSTRGETLLKKLNVPESAVFTSINGVSLDKPFQALGALQSLQTATEINVTYLFNGVEQSRDFEL